MAVFITLEGGEGAGKSTQIPFIQDLIAQHLHTQVLCVREPGGTELCERMRAILKERNSEKLCDKAELLLMYASRAQLVESLIKPSLKANISILSDRFDLSTLAYQGGGRGIDHEILAQLRSIALDGFTADLTLLFDIDVREGFKRTQTRGLGGDRFEDMDVSFFERVRQTYLQAAAKDNSIKIIDASKSIAQVQEQIRAILEDFFNAR